MSECCGYGLEILVTTFAIIRSLSYRESVWCVGMMGWRKSHYDCLLQAVAFFYFPFEKDCTSKKKRRDNWFDGKPGTKAENGIRGWDKRDAKAGVLEGIGSNCT